MSGSLRKGRARARRNVEDAAMFDELEEDLRHQHPTLLNIRVNSATPQELDIEPDPRRQWYGVTFYADDQP